MPPQDSLCSLVDTITHYVFKIYQTVEACRKCWVVFVPLEPPITSYNAENTCRSKVQTIHVPDYLLETSRIFLADLARLRQTVWNCIKADKHANAFHTLSCSDTLSHCNFLFFFIITQFIANFELPHRTIRFPVFDNNGKLTCMVLMWRNSEAFCILTLVKAGSSFLSVKFMPHVTSQKEMKPYSVQK